MKSLLESRNRIPGGGAAASSLGAGAASSAKIRNESLIKRFDIPAGVASGAGSAWGSAKFVLINSSLRFIWIL